MAFTPLGKVGLGWRCNLRRMLDVVVLCPWFEIGLLPECATTHLLAGELSVTSKAQSILAAAPRWFAQARMLSQFLIVALSATCHWFVILSRIMAF